MAHSGVLEQFMEQRAALAKRRSHMIAAAVEKVVELHDADGLTAVAVLQLADRYRRELNIRRKTGNASREELEDLRRVIEVFDALHRSLQV